MEDILDIYKLPLDPKKPVICFDEMTKQLIKNVRDPIPVKPGKPMKEDFHYEKKGIVNIFIFAEPKAGKRFVQVYDTKTSFDFAESLRMLVEEYYPDVDKIILILDNLRTHHLKFLYEKFDPRRAREIAKKLELHYTPKYASWLNIAEIELSALHGMCLDRRIGEKKAMEKEIKAWVRQRNSEIKGVDWQFSKEDARTKLKYLYPRNLT
jgi:hypothetical protein